MSFKIILQIEDPASLDPSRWAAFEWSLRKFAQSSMPASWSRQLATNWSLSPSVDRVSYEGVPFKIAKGFVEGRLKASADDLKVLAEYNGLRGLEDLEETVASMKTIDDALKADGFLDQVEIRAREVRRSNGIRSK